MCVCPSRLLVCLYLAIHAADNLWMLFLAHATSPTLCHVANLWVLLLFVPEFCLWYCFSSLSILTLAVVTIAARSMVFVLADSTSLTAYRDLLWACCVYVHHRKRGKQ